MDERDIPEIPPNQHDITQSIKIIHFNSVFPQQEHKDEKEPTIFIGKSQTAIHGESTVTSGFQAYLPDLQQAGKARR
jgi:hypothetical protein